MINGNDSVGVTYCPDGLRFSCTSGLQLSQLLLTSSESNISISRSVEQIRLEYYKQLFAQRNTENIDREILGNKTAIFSPLAYTVRRRYFIFRVMILLLSTLYISEAFKNLLVTIFLPLSETVFCNILQPCQLDELTNYIFRGEGGHMAWSGSPLLTLGLLIIPPAGSKFLLNPRKVGKGVGV